MAINKETKSGGRDHVLFNLMYNTGARVSEVINLRTTDIDFQKVSSISIRGKGRKERRVPLWASTSLELKKWLRNINDGDYIFTNNRNEPLSRSGVEFRLKEMVKRATLTSPSIKRKKVSPHTIRHTTAMHLLESGVDITMIALWLGHSNIQTTHGYIEADLKMKSKSLEKLQSPENKGLRYKAKDSLLEILEKL